MNNSPLHPSEALRTCGVELPLIPACEHVCGLPKFVTKAFALQREKQGIFDITVDLEDGAPAGAEQQHLSALIESVREAFDSDLNYRFGFRVHDYESGLWKNETTELLKHFTHSLRYLCIPKVDDLSHLSEMIAFSREQAKAFGRLQPLPIHILIETHQAVKQAFKFAAVPEVEALIFGIMDFVSSHFGAIPACCMESPGQFEHQLLIRAKTRLTAAALAYGKIPVHNVTIDFSNAEATESDARRAKGEFGFLRMWSIHPAQISPIISAFMPEHDELELASAVILAGSKASWGPAKVSGKLYDRASYRYYWELIKRAHLAQLSLPTEITSLFF